MKKEASYFPCSSDIGSFWTALPAIMTYANTRSGVMYFLMLWIVSGICLGKALISMIPIFYSLYAAATRESGIMTKR